MTTLTSNMSSILASLILVMSATVLTVDHDSVEQTIYSVSSALIPALIGASALIRFRPEPKMTKAFTKALSSAAFGLIFGSALIDALHVEKSSYRSGVYALAGLSSLIILQALVISLEQKVPILVNGVVDFGSNKLQAIIGVKEKQPDGSEKVKHLAVETIVSQEVREVEPPDDESKIHVTI